MGGGGGGGGGGSVENTLRLIVRYLWLASSSLVNVERPG